MDNAEKIHEDLRRCANDAIKARNWTAADVARSLKINPVALRGFLAGTKTHHISSVRYAQILLACGIDLVARISGQSRKATNELRKYLDRPLVAVSIKNGAIPDDELQLLYAADQIGTFRGRSPLWIEDWHNLRRHEAGRAADEIAAKGGQR
jgi:hypothetical protein